jgi:hypothetical protein
MLRDQGSIRAEQSAAAAITQRPGNPFRPQQTTSEELIREAEGGAEVIPPVSLAPRPGSITAPLPNRKIGDEGPSSVTVNIGRIEVEVARPPALPTTAARPAPARTRGFDAYARARRGYPR